MVETLPEWSQEVVARCVSTVVTSRRSVRAFRPDPLRRDIVEEILDEAASAPSGANIQPRMPRQRVQDFARLLGFLA